MPKGGIFVSSEYSRVFLLFRFLHGQLMNSNLILITGDDEDLIRKKTSEAIKAAAGEEPDEFSIDIIKETDESTPVQLLNDIIKSIQTPSFFGQKTVCLSNCEFLDQEGNKTDNAPIPKHIRELADLINEGIPADIILIISGKGVDSRKGLFKACKNQNAEIHNFKKLQLTGKWKDQVTALIRQQARDKNLNLQHNAIEYLTVVIGTESGRINSELEKVACACVGKDSISLADISDICSGNASTAFWAFSNALGDRNLKSSIKAIDDILHQTKDPESAVMGLLQQTAGHFKLLLKGKIFMQMAGLKSPDQVQQFLNNISAADKEKYKDYEFTSMHPFRAYNLAKNAQKYTGQELIEAIRLFTETNRKIVSSPVSRRLILEQLSTAVIKGNRKVLQGT